jgi:hypothetical protein
MTWVLVRMNLGIITVRPPIAHTCRVSRKQPGSKADVGHKLRYRDCTRIRLRSALLHALSSASPVGLVAAIVIALVAYKLVRALKAAFDKISVRSFLQD